MGTSVTLRQLKLLLHFYVVRYHSQLRKGRQRWLSATNGPRLALHGRQRMKFLFISLQFRLKRLLFPSATNNSKRGGGRQVSFILEKRREPNYTDSMKHRINSEKGKTIYSHRMSVVEPVFGNIGTNKGLIRFSLRGKKKVQGQWQLFCMVHNIEKLNNYGEMAA